MQPRGRANAFTIIEMMVAMAVLSLILVVMFQITSSTTKIWQHTRARIDTFQEARGAFETVTKNISQAMLNTYFDYVDGDDSRVDLVRKANGNESTIATALRNFKPESYRRQSELHFVSGVSKNLLTGMASQGSTPFDTVGEAIFFQAPLGSKEPALTGDSPTNTDLDSLLNACGYYLEYGDDAKDRPRFLENKNPKPRKRLRLMELRQPAERMTVYNYLSKSSDSWFVDALNQSDSGRYYNRHVVAENIIAMVVIPSRSAGDPAKNTDTDPLAENYFYDSRDYLTKGTDARAKVMCNQLPPMVRVIFVAIDEKTAARLEEQGKDPISEFHLDSLFQNYSTKSAAAATPSDDALRDLKTLEDKLTQARVSYRVFSTDVNIMQAKWSE